MPSSIAFSCRGYFAPEYLNDGKTSFQCDIYSLGVIITEIVTGRRKIPDNNDIVREISLPFYNKHALLFAL